MPKFPNVALRRALVSPARSSSLIILETYGSLRVCGYCRGACALRTRVQRQYAAVSGPWQT